MKLLRRLVRPFWATRRRRLLTLGAVGFVIFSIGFTEMTSQSWFCNSCHIMNSYYASWKVGTHKDVQCIECHIPPGTQNFVQAKLNGAGQVVDDLLNRTNSKPSASVSDFSCTRSSCHELDKVRAIARDKNPYFFEHAKHLGLEYVGIVIHCTTCHSHVKGGTHFEVNTSVCITCHLSYAGSPRPAAPPVPAGMDSRLLSQAAATGPDSAAATGPDSAWAAGPASQPTSRTDLARAGDGKVPPSQCQSCHNPPAEPINYHGLSVVHADYVKYKPACESCHRGVTSPARRIRDDTCFSCHDFGMEKMTGVVETHRIHSQGKHKVECLGCHGLSSHGPQTQAMRLDQIDCQACHHGQHNIQRETYATAAGSPHEPPAAGSLVTPMFMAHVDCTGCHIQPRPVRANPQSGASVAEATPKACDSCHAKGLGEKMIPEWQQATHKLYDSAMKLYDSVSRAVGEPAALPAGVNVAQRPPAVGTPVATGHDKAVELVREAARLLELVRLDGSWGVHNPVYTAQVIKTAREKLIEAEKLGHAGLARDPARWEGGRAVNEMSKANLAAGLAPRGSPERAPALNEPLAGLAPRGASPAAKRRFYAVIGICSLTVSFAGVAVLRAASSGPAAPTTRTANCTAGDCHAKERQYKVLHGPVALGACDVCHVYADEKAHKFTLKREKGALCTFCHIGKAEGKFVHKAVQDGQCLGCHNPHGGPDRSLLRAADVGKLCAGCHGDVAKGRSHVHGPVAAGNCVACHNAHSSDLPKLLVAKGRKLCLGCHEQMGKQLKEVKFVHKPAKGECTQCHEVHASNHIMQLKQAPLDLCSSCHGEIKKIAETAADKHSPVTGDTACLNCHTPHGGDFARLMKSKPLNVCLTCHDKQIKTDTRTVASMAALADPKEFKHGPIRDGNCAGCHTPHGGPNGRLLVKPYPEAFYQPFEEDKYALCFSCHDKDLVLLAETNALTNFRNGEQNLHYLHVNRPVQGRNCRVCHETHVSKRPLHIRDSVPFGQWDMPINFEQTKTGGSCSPGCHQRFGYDRVTQVSQPKSGTGGQPGSTTRPEAGQPSVRPAGPPATRPLDEPPVMDLTPAANQDSPADRRKEKT